MKKDDIQQAKQPFAHEDAVSPGSYLVLCNDCLGGHNACFSTREEAWADARAHNANTSIHNGHAGSANVTPREGRC